MVADVLWRAAVTGHLPTPTTTLVDLYLVLTHTATIQADLTVVRHIHTLTRLIRLTLCVEITIVRTLDYYGCLILCIDIAPCFT